MIETLTAWTVAWSLHPLAPWALFLIALAESSFFPIPPDIVLIPMALSNASSAFFYAGICTLGSVLGATIGFIIGAKGGRPLIKKFFKEEQLSKVEKLFQDYGGWAVGMAAFTPIPFKVFTLSAGAFRAKFRPFLISSTLGRGARFFMISLLIFLWGEQAKGWIQENFAVLSIILALLLIISVIIFRRFQRL
ncbi:MAG: DedA family protein [Deltaproteobacteria bacterium]|nr:DedA family protein [Deltaproteobacteria bacterium]